VLSHMEYTEHERLKDLDDKDSKSLIRILMDYLENANGSAEVDEICQELSLPKLLVEDLIQLLILKEWLVLPTNGVELNDN
jgi:uncharacterized protein YqeY